MGLDVLTTCGTSCCHFYEGAYTGIQRCYKNGIGNGRGKLVTEGDNCHYDVRAKQEPEPKQRVMVPVATVSADEFRRLQLLRGSCRATSYLSILADQIDERRAKRLKRKRE